VCVSFRLRVRVLRVVVTCVHPLRLRQGSTDHKTELPEDANFPCVEIAGETFYAEENSIPWQHNERVTDKFDVLITGTQCRNSCTDDVKLTDSQWQIRWVRGTTRTRYAS